MRKINENIWERLIQKTIIQIFNENDLFIYKEAEKPYIFKWQMINKREIREEIKSIKYPGSNTGFLRNIYVMDEEDYVEIDEKIKEKLEERLYFATKYINEDFKNVPKKEVTNFLLEVADEMTDLIDIKVEEKSKEYILEILEK